MKFNLCATINFKHRGPLYVCLLMKKSTLFKMMMKNLMKTLLLIVNTITLKIL